jgi:periplasmic divalent cation tolerance protein
MESYFVVFVTCPNQQEAEKIVDIGLKARLIACGNIIPGMQSLFHWQGNISSEKEVLIIMKTRQKLLDELIQWIEKEHSYKVPEIIVLPIVGGSGDYLNWIKEETSQ